VGTVLRVQVLSAEQVKDRLGKEDPKHTYWIVGRPMNELHTLQEMQDMMDEGVKANPPLQKLEILLPEDAPDKRLFKVAALEAAARERKLDVQYPEPNK